MDNERIVILVENGMVSEVFAETSRVSVEVLDLDTDDSDRCAEIEYAKKRLNEEIRTGRLVSVY